MINLYLIDYFSQNSSGLTTYVDQLTRGIYKDHRVKLHFILVKASGHKDFAKEETRNGTTYYVPHEVAQPSNHDLDFRLADYLKTEIDGKGKVIFHFNWINHAPFSQLLKRTIDCATVLTKHCIPWRDLITGNYPVFYHFNKQLLAKENVIYLNGSFLREHIAYNAVDHIICVTRSAQFELAKVFHFSRKNTTVIPNGLQPNKLNARSKNELKLEYGFDPDEAILLYAGNIHERKGVFDLVAAFEHVLDQYKKVRLVIAGDGDYREIFKNARKNWSKVTVTGALDKKTLFDFYDMADVGVVPSYVEQCSYTTIEMMYHRLPIVVCDVDGLAEMIPNDCGLKTPLILGKKRAFVDKDTLAKNILYFLQNKEVSNQYAFRARQLALRNHSAKKMVAETIGVYEKLVARSVRKPTNTHLPGNPLVSVLLPCLNGENYLAECIDSVLRQTYANFELIIIDDGSEDKTATIIKRYKDKRIRTYYSKHSRGVVESLNQGIKMASGKYIARIDADDIMHEDRLYKQAKYLEDNEKEGVALVGSYHYVINQMGRIVGFKQYPVSYGEIMGTMLFQNPFSHPTVMFRADVVREINYSSKYPHAEDYHLWFNILRSFKAANLPEYLTYYRVHDKSVSKQQQDMQRESVADLLSAKLDKLSINHSVSELTTHIAIYFGYRARYFNTAEKIDALKQWMDRVLLAQKERNEFTNKFVKELKTHVLQMYCGVY